MSGAARQILSHVAVCYQATQISEFWKLRSGKSETGLVKARFRLYFLSVVARLFNSFV